MQNLQERGAIWESLPSIKLAMNTWRTWAPTSSAKLHWHRHPFYELGVVFKGEADWRIGRSGRHRVGEGMALLLKPNTLHAEELIREPGADFAWIGFQSQGALPDWVHRPIPLGEDFAEVERHFWIISQELHGEGRASRLRVALALQSILLLVARQAEEAGEERRKPSGLNPRQVQLVQATAHYLRENLRDPLSIAQLAAYHSLCAAHFSTLFQRHFGISPRAFLMQARLDAAASMLSHSVLNVKEIAQECGFVDAAHFCKAFKNARGLTPLAFRHSNEWRSLRGSNPQPLP